MSQMTDAEILDVIKKRYDDADVVLIGFIPISVSRLDEILWGGPWNERETFGIPYWNTGTCATIAPKIGTV